jgi:hypothetical protein
VQAISPTTLRLPPSAPVQNTSAGSLCSGLLERRPADCYQHKLRSGGQILFHAADARGISLSQRFPGLDCLNVGFVVDEGTPSWVLHNRLFALGGSGQIAPDATCSTPAKLCCKERGTAIRFYSSGGQRQFHPLWRQALGCISAEEHPNIFVYEPGGVIGSHDHACFETQQRIGKRLYDHTVRMKACRRRLRKDLQWLAAG